MNTTPTPEQSTVQSTDVGAGPKKLGTSALLRWGDEGGSGPIAEEDTNDHAPVNARSETEQLNTRISALESLVVALLAQVSARQRTRISDMATSDLTRDGATAHLLTTEAACRVRHLIEVSDDL